MQEETHRRNEESMRRKANIKTLNPLSPTALSSDSDAPKSPASTGAMDDLLQKLRAAKPEAKDQRDRRRRARLKDRHQVRVASGQQIPELGVNMEEEGAEEGEGAEKGKGMLSPASETSESVDNNIVTTSIDTPDVADRAAAMLEGLQTGGLNKDGSLSVRRRRESADTERERRRRRRQQASSAKTEDGVMMSPTIPEEGEERRGSVFSADGTEEATQPGTPVIGVMPPSPEGKGGEKERDDLPSPPPEWS